MTEKVVIGNAELWHGDCREVLPLLPHVALVLTDPPYGIGIDGQKQSTNRNPKHNRKAHDFLGWDTETPERLVFELLRYKSDGQIVWGGATTSRTSCRTRQRDGCSGTRASEG